MQSGHTCHVSQHVPSGCHLQSFVLLENFKICILPCELVHSLVIVAPTCQPQISYFMQASVENTIEFTITDGLAVKVALISAYALTVVITLTANDQFILVVKVRTSFYMIHHFLPYFTLVRTKILCLNVQSYQWLLYLIDIIVLYFVNNLFFASVAMYCGVACFFTVCNASCTAYQFLVATYGNSYLCNVHSSFTSHLPVVLVVIIVFLLCFDLLLPLLL